MKLHNFIDNTPAIFNKISLVENNLTEKRYPGKSSGALKRWINTHYGIEPSCRAISRVKNDPDATNFYKKRASWYQNIHCKGSKQIMKEEDDNFDLSDEVISFINGLTPDDAGYSHIGDHKVHFAGLSDNYKTATQRRCALHPTDPQHLADYDHIYNEILSHFINKENGVNPLSSGLAGSDDNPIMYAVFLPNVDETDVDVQINEALSTIPMFKKFLF